MGKNNIEIERKWTLDINKIPFDISEYEHKEIEQGYIGKTNNGKVIRIRRIGDIKYITVKGRGSMAKMEIEVPITEEQYRMLMPSVSGYMIRKTRYYVPDGDLTIEIDVFKDKLAGFDLVEVEFQSVEQGNEYVPKEWFGHEVTDIKGYSNYYLSKRGAPLMIDLPTLAGDTKELFGVDKGKEYARVFGVEKAAVDDRFINVVVGDIETNPGFWYGLFDGVIDKSGWNVENSVTIEGKNGDVDMFNRAIGRIRENKILKKAVK